MPGETPHSQVSSTARRWLYRAHGVYTIVAGACLGFFCWLIPMLLHKIVAHDAVDPTNLPAAARGVLEHRGLMPLLALPAIVFGVVALTRAPWRLLWAILGLLFVLLPAVLLIYTFLTSIGLLYTYQPL